MFQNTYLLCRVNETDFTFRNNQRISSKHKLAKLNDENSVIQGVGQVGFSDGDKLCGETDIKK